MNKVKLTTIILAFFALLNFTQLSLAKKKVAQPAMPPAIVETQVVKYTTEQQQLAATGTLLALPGIIVRPEISGRITNIFFKPGEKVKSGDPLIEINPDISKAQLDNAKANLKLQQLNFERFKRLYKTRTIAKADFDKARSDLDSAQAQVNLANARLRQTLICAPFAGKVGLNLVSIGSYVNAGQDLVSLQALNPIYVDFPIPEVYLKQVAVSQKIALHSDAYPKQTFTGKVFAIDPLINQKTRSISVRAIVPNQDEKLLPGVFVEVTLFVSIPHSIIKIPQTAVIYDAKGNYVYKYVNGKAVRTQVTLGKRDEKNIVLLSGLKIGDIVITSGQLKIFMDNAPVIVAPTSTSH